MPRPLATLSALAATLVALALAAPRVADAKGAQLVLIGGEVDDERIFAEIVRRAGGTNVHVGIVTAASANAEKNGRHWEKVFRDAGAAKASWLPLDGTEDVEGLDVIYFGGGGQDRLKKALTSREGSGARFMAAVTRRFAKGSLLVAGTSAGAAVQPSAPMILGGEGLDAILGGTPAHDPDGGLGLFTHGLIDTHFGERGRHARLTRLASDLGVRHAYGVDENTALFVDDALGPRTRMKVVGGGGVSVFDLGGARRADGKRFQIDRVRLDYLTHGDELDPSMGTIQLGAGKQGTRGPSLRAGDVRDVFSSARNRNLGVNGDERRTARRSLVRLATVAAGRGKTIGGHAWESNQAHAFVSPGPTGGAFAIPGTTGPASLIDVRLALRDTGKHPSSGPSGARGARGGR